MTVKEELQINIRVYKKLFHEFNLLGKIFWSVPLLLIALISTCMEILFMKRE